MARNLALYPWLLVCQHLLFWMPAFFLYFASVLPAEQVLALESLYYLGVVLLEVPSGYFSDHVGRRVTLLIAMGAWTAAGIVFALAQGFAAFAAAQLLLATGMAFFSGTDSALLYDSLLALGRPEEFGAREARARSRAYLALGAATGVGGLLAGLALRLPYVLFAAASAAGVAIAWRMEEPTAADAAAATTGGRLREVLGRLGQPGLAWLFAYAVVMTVLVHVPYEYLQPYLALLLTGRVGGTDSLTPAASGALMVGMMLLSAVASGNALRLQARLGLGGALLLGLGVECAIIAAMAAVLHPAVLAVVLLRSVPMAILTPLANAAIHPRLGSGIRATYLSLQSLAGRLGFSATLALASWAIGGVALTAPILRGLLWANAGGGLLALGALALSAAALGRLAPARTP